MRCDPFKKKKKKVGTPCGICQFWLALTKNNLQKWYYIYSNYVPNSNVPFRWYCNSFACWEVRLTRSPFSYTYRSRLFFFPINSIIKSIKIINYKKNYNFSLLTFFSNSYLLLLLSFQWRCSIFKHRQLIFMILLLTNWGQFILLFDWSTNLIKF